MVLVSRFSIGPAPALSFLPAEKQEPLSNRIDLRGIQRSESTAMIDESETPCRRNRHGRVQCRIGESPLLPWGTICAFAGSSLRAERLALANHRWRLPDGQEDGQDPTGTPACSASPVRSIFQPRHGCVLPPPASIGARFGESHSRISGRPACCLPCGPDHVRFHSRDDDGPTG